MDKEKRSTCRHSAGRKGNIAVDVHPSYPNYIKIKGNLMSTVSQCRKCEDYERKQR